MQPVASAESLLDQSGVRTCAEAVCSPGGELADFDGLVAKYWPKIFRFALASLRDPDAAGTVAQDCLMRAHRGAAGFRGQSSVSTWLMQIAVNLVRDQARSRRLQFWKRTREAPVDWDDVDRRTPNASASPESRAIAQQQTRAIWEATARLSERRRTVFLLRFVEEMEVLEIAAATGLCEGTVKAHLFRAVEAIRKQLKGIR
jgi:RNA polymerase sigma-70 factor (ECF subfamily)